MKKEMLSKKLFIEGHSQFQGDLYFNSHLFSYGRNVWNP